MNDQNLDWLENEILRSIRRIVRAIEMSSQSLVARVGLTSPQLSVLKAVQRLLPATPTTIARELSLSQPTVSGILDRLMARGLLERGQSTEDRRQKHYRLTQESERLISAAPALLQEQFQQRLAQLEDWERSMLLASLQRVAHLMDIEGLEAHPVLTSGSAPLGADLDSYAAGDVTADTRGDRVEQAPTGSRAPSTRPAQPPLGVGPSEPNAPR